MFFLAPILDGRKRACDIPLASHL